MADMPRVLIAVIGDSAEAEAIRQVLESFGCLVLTKYIGWPNDLITVLSGTIPFDPDIVILSGHGENGAIIMPVLADSVYTECEPKGNFSSAEISQYLSLTGKTIISTCCTTGAEDLVSAFSKENVYIAPAGYVEGDAVLLFLVDFFYQIIRRRLTIEDAWTHARSLDEETAQFVLCSKAN